LNQLNEAKDIYKKALDRSADNRTVHFNRYAIAFLEGDDAEMDRQVAWAGGKPGVESFFLWSQADTAAFSGQLVRARDLSQRSVESSVRASEKELAAEVQLDAALRDAEMGDAGAAREHITSALALASTRDIQTLAAFALARVGQTSASRKLLDHLAATYPSNTLLNSYWLPTIRAALELDRKNPTQAVELLRAAAPYETGTFRPLGGNLYSVYLRGQAYLLLRKGNEAAAEFQKFTHYRGVVGNYPWGASARLGLARAYSLQGDTAKAKAAYQNFLTLWKDADPDIPILKQAKAEYAKLQ